MKIIIDTNVLISALLRDSITRKIIVSVDFDFFYPAVALPELMKYTDEILRRSGMDEATFWILLCRLLGYIDFIPEEKSSQKLSEATEIMQKIDPNDISFIASALVLENAFLWSEDKDFEKQNKVQVIKTRDLVQFFL